MLIHAIHSFLVHPSKAVEDPPKIIGTDVELKGKLFGMLADVYSNSEHECKIEVSFNHDSAGQQNNPARDLLIAYITKPTVDAGRNIAMRLQSVTTKRSGLGLLFLIAGKDVDEHKIVVSRFPADNGVLAEQRRGEFTIEFLERIFMKSATSFKAATYVGTSLKAGFWDGRCVDKQVNNDVITISDYWIRDFLASDFKTTSAAGTRRLAVAMRSAMKAAETIGVKEEMVAAAKLVSGLHGKTLTAKSLPSRFSFSPEAKNVFERQFSPKLYSESFKFDGAEFSKHVAFASIELDNGAILTAEASNFDKVFKREQEGEKVRFSTEGKVVAQRLRQNKL